MAPVTPYKVKPGSSRVSHASLTGRGFSDELRELLHVPVDVVPDDGLKPRVHASIEADLVPDAQPVSRSDRERLLDVLAAIHRHLERVRSPTG